jgi:hypothetical protein
MTNLSTPTAPQHPTHNIFKYNCNEKKKEIAKHENKPQHKPKYQIVT